MVNVPGEGCDHDTVFSAAAAADPIATLLTVTRALSKPRLKLTPETWAPPEDVKLTVTEIPVSPGAPEPDPTDKAALAV